MSDHHHFNDQGFDPQVDFFQVLGEARRHIQHREAATARARDHSSSSSSSAVRFKLQKPIGKDQEKKKSSSRNRKSRWWWSWRSALDLFYFKLKWPVQGQQDKPENWSPRAMSLARPSGHSVSGPLYLADCSNASKPRHRGYSRSGPLSTRVPYVCLSTDLSSAIAPPPLYLVT